MSATSGYFVNHLKQYANNMFKKFNLKPDNLVVDIGSNDGTCLSFFKDLGMNVIGVDPATEIAKKATDKGIFTVDEFFSYKLAVELRNKYGTANYVTSIMLVRILIIYLT